LSEDNEHAKTQVQIREALVRRRRVVAAALLKGRTASKNSLGCRMRLIHLRNHQTGAKPSRKAVIKRWNRKEIAPVPQTVVTLDKGFAARHCNCGPGRIARSGVG
jgi:hypothetical protein